MTLLLRRTADTAVVVLALLVLVIGGADAALAHFAGGREPSSYRGEITSVTPAMPGVSFTLTDAADRIEVRSTSTTPTIIYGYQHKEPGDRDAYLKVSADGVWVNTESQAGYLNETLLGATESIPQRLRDDTGEGTPVWKKVSDTGVYRWHDHRIHWMSVDPPPAVAADPGASHHIITDWHIYAKQGDAPESTITGQLYWVPAAPAPWWFGTIGFAIAGLVAGLGRARGPLLAAAGVLAVASLAQAFVTPLPQDAYQGDWGFVLASALVPALAVAGMCALAWRSLAARSGAWRYVLGAAGAIAALQGASDLTVITRSQLEHSGPTWLVRLVVVCAVGLGIGLLAAMIWRALRRPADATGRADAAGIDIASDEEMQEIVAGAPGSDGWRRTRCARADDAV